MDNLNDNEKKIVLMEMIIIIIIIIIVSAIVIENVAWHKFVKVFQFNELISVTKVSHLASKLRFDPL